MAASSTTGEITKSNQINQLKQAFNNKQRDYKRDMQTFVQDTGNSKLFHEDIDLQSKHEQLKSHHCKQYASQVNNPTEDLVRLLESAIDKIFPTFARENDQNRQRCLKLEQQGFQNIKDKFSEKEQELEQEINRNPLNFICPIQRKDLMNVFYSFTKDLPNKWKTYFDNWYLNHTEIFLNEVSNVPMIIEQYKAKMLDSLNESICLEPSCLEKLHLSLKSEIVGGKCQNWNYDSSRNLAIKAIDIVNLTIKKQNADIIEDEKKIVQQALQFADEKYHEFMKSQVGKEGMNSIQLEKLHEVYVEAATEAFFKIPEFIFSYLWKSQENTLRNNLQQQLQHFCNLLEKHHGPKSNVETKIKSPPVDCISNERDYKISIYKKPVSDFKQDTKPKTNPTIVNELDLNFNPGQSLLPERNEWGYGIKMNPIVKPQPQYGIGIYLGPDVVRVGVYPGKSLEPFNIHFQPWITFKENEVVFFEGNQDGSCDTFSIHSLLTTTEQTNHRIHKYAISGIQLRSEEILAIYLGRVKSITEQKTGQEIKSCVVVLDTYMTTSARHMVKVALFLAGFEKSKLMQTTTAIGLTYVIRNKPAKGKVTPIAIIHKTGRDFAIALARVTHSSVSVKSVSGTPLLNTTAKSIEQDGIIERIIKYIFGSREVKNLQEGIRVLINNALLASKITQKELKELVLVKPGTSEDDNEATILNVLGNPSVSQLREVDPVLLGPSVINAWDNDSQANMEPLEYKEVYPYKITATITGTSQSYMEQKHIVDRNDEIIPLECINSVKDGYNFKELIIEEIMGDLKPSIIGQCKINSNCERSIQFRFQVNLDSEGLVQASIKPQEKNLDSRIKIDSSFWTSEELSEAFRKLQSLSLLAKAESFKSVKNVQIVQHDGK